MNHEEIEVLAKSISEEVTALSDYRERSAKCMDPTIKKVLDHAAMEEAEHFALFVEVLRRNDKDVDKALKEHLFSNKIVTD